MDYEILRESAELDYKEVASGAVVYDYDHLFMEACIDAGFTMDEAVDAKLQKIKLYISEEAKLCKRLAKETHAAVRKKNYEAALESAKKRLQHLQNLENRADDIDDDEVYIIQMESTAKAFIVTAVTTMVLVKVADGIVPGSGKLVKAFQAAVKKFKMTEFKKGLKGSIAEFIQKMVMPILSIYGFSKKVGSAFTSKTTDDWRKNHKGDINREVREGRPDPSSMSVSRTQAKTRFRKMIEAQKEEIAILTANLNAQKRGKTETKNESVDTLSGLYECFAILSESNSATVTMEILQEAKLKAAARNELSDSEFGLPDERKYPLNDAAHVKAAIKMFSHCPDDKKKQLANRITRAMTKFNIDTKFDEKSPMYNYVSNKFKK